MSSNKQQSEMGIMIYYKLPGIVAKHWRYGEISNDHFTTNLLMKLLVIKI